MTSDRMLVVGRGGIDAELVTQMATQGHRVATPDQATRSFCGLVYHLNVTTATRLSSYAKTFKPLPATYASSNTTMGPTNRCGVHSFACMLTTLAYTTRKVVNQYVPETTALGWPDESATVSVMEKSLSVPKADLKQSTLALDNSIESVALPCTTTTRFMRRKLPIREGNWGTTPTAPAEYTRLEQAIKGGQP